MRDNISFDIILNLNGVYIKPVLDKEYNKIGGISNG